MYRAAMRSIFSELARQDRLVIVKDFDLGEPRTKSLIKKLGDYNEIDTSKYMSPLKIFEYMSANKAIICSNHRVLKEILKPGYSALMCNPDNFNEWKAALLSLKNKKKRYFLAQNSYSQFLQKFTWQKRVELIFD